jgi:hypothetical protein
LLSSLGRLKGLAVSPRSGLPRFANFIICVLSGLAVIIAVLVPIPAGAASKTTVAPPPPTTTVPAPTAPTVPDVAAPTPTDGRQPESDERPTDIAHPTLLPFLRNGLLGCTSNAGPDEPCTLGYHPWPAIDFRIPGGRPVRAVEAALDTINGRYQVSWRITDEAFEITVLVPCNCSADVIMPDDTVHEVVAGEHSFAMPFQHAGDGIPILREVSGG